MFHMSREKQLQHSECCEKRLVHQLYNVRGGIFLNHSHESRARCGATRGRRRRQSSERFLKQNIYM